MILKNLLLVILISGLIGIILGIVSPRFTATIINNYPVEKLGGIMKTVNARLIISPPLASVIFPLIASVNINIVNSSGNFSLNIKLHEDNQRTNDL